MTDTHQLDMPTDSDDQTRLVLAVKSLDHLVKGVLIAPGSSIIFTPGGLYTGFDTLRTGSVFYQEYLDGLAQDPPFRSGEVKLIVRAQVRERRMAFHSDGHNLFLTKRGRTEYPQELAMAYGPRYESLFGTIATSIWEHIANYQPFKREQEVRPPAIEPDIFDLISGPKKA